MKILRFIALAILSITLLSGCDAIRSALGKPTSKDIAALRAQKSRMLRTGDSLAVEMGALPDLPDGAGEETAGISADSTGSAAAEAAADTTALQRDTTAGQDEPAVTEEPEERPAGLASGYYVVLGSFKNEDNAQYYYNSLSASGAEVHLVKMKNGFTAVMICHGSTYEESYSKMLDFYSDKKKPEDIWIYNTAKQLHIE